MDCLSAAAIYGLARSLLIAHHGTSGVGGARFEQSWKVGGACFYCSVGVKRCHWASGSQLQCFIRKTLSGGGNLGRFTFEKSN